jgi:hypothetical protein
MRNRAEEYGRANSVPPAYVYNLLRAAYGFRAAEGIFRSHGITPPVTARMAVQVSRMA